MFINNLKQQVAVNHEHLINRSQQTRLKELKDNKNKMKKMDNVSNSVDIIAVLESMDSCVEKKRIEVDKDE